MGARNFEPKTTPAPGHRIDSYLTPVCFGQAVSPWRAPDRFPPLTKPTTARKVRTRPSRHLQGAPDRCLRPRNGRDRGARGARTVMRRTPPEPLPMNLAALRTKLERMTPSMLGEQARGHVRDGFDGQSECPNRRSPTRCRWLPRARPRPPRCKFSAGARARLRKGQQGVDHL